MKFNKFVNKFQELKLPYHGPIIGEQLLVSGWGYSGKQKPRSLLKSVNISVLDRSICVRYYKKREIKMPISAFCGGT